MNYRSKTSINVSLLCRHRPCIVKVQNSYGRYKMCKSAWTFCTGQRNFVQQQYIITHDTSKKLIFLSNFWTKFVPLGIFNSCLCSGGQFCDVKEIGPTQKCFEDKKRKWYWQVEKKVSQKALGFKLHEKQDGCKFNVTFIWRHAKL